ncbi:MAG: FHA domain-containing protein [Chloroflexota bacterium]
MITYLFLGLRLIMAAALYTFVGWSILTMWRSLNNHNQYKLGNLIPTLSINFSTPGFTNQSFQQSTIRIGRRSHNECPIDDSTISSEHATLSYHHKQWWLEVNRSKNGTYLNDEQVTESVVITTQDNIRCGKVNFTVAIAPE